MDDIKLLKGKGPTMDDIKWQTRQMLQMFHPQQMQGVHPSMWRIPAEISDQTKHPHQDQLQESQTEKVVPQGPPHVVALLGDELWNRRKRIVLDAVTSLFEDQIVPHNLLVLQRIKETSGERWSLPQLSQICERLPEIRIVGEDEPRHLKIMLRDPPSSFRYFVDHLSPEDPYPNELWLKIKAFVEQQLCVRIKAFLEKAAPDPYAGWPKCRYDFAKWMRSRLDCLSTYSLGHVCHIVQLCISKKEFLGYHSGSLVPYYLSDAYKRKASTSQSIPSQISPSERDSCMSCAQSWEQAGELIARLVDQNFGAVRLSSLKEMSRKMFRVEISASAMGHTNLLQLLQDHRLRSPIGGAFELEQRGTQWYIVHKAPSQKDIPESGLVEESEPSHHREVVGQSPAQMHVSKEDALRPGFRPPPGLFLPAVVPSMMPLLDINRPAERPLCGEDALGPGFRTPPGLSLPAVVPSMTPSPGIGAATTKQLPPWRLKKGLAQFSSVELQKGKETNGSLLCPYNAEVENDPEQQSTSASSNNGDDVMSIHSEEIAEQCHAGMILSQVPSSKIPDEYICVKHWQPVKEIASAMTLLHGERLQVTWIDGCYNGWAYGTSVDDASKKGYFPQHCVAVPKRPPSNFAVGQTYTVSDHFQAPTWQSGYLCVAPGDHVIVMHQDRDANIWVYARRSGDSEEFGWLPEAVIAFF